MSCATPELATLHPYGHLISLNCWKTPTLLVRIASAALAASRSQAVRSTAELYSVCEGFPFVTLLFLSLSFGMGFLYKERFRYRSTTLRSFSGV